MGSAARAAKNVAQKVTWRTEVQPGVELYTAVRAGLTLKGTSFAAECLQRGVARQWVRQALLGLTNGPRAAAIRRDFAAAAGIQ